MYFVGQFVEAEIEDEKGNSIKAIAKIEEVLPPLSLVVEMFTSGERNLVHFPQVRKIEGMELQIKMMEELHQMGVNQ